MKFLESEINEISLKLDILVNDLILEHEQKFAKEMLACAIKNI